MEERNKKSRSKMPADRKASLVMQWLEEKQGQALVALDVRGVNSYTEALVLASAMNMRHAQALSDWVLSKFRENNLEVLGVEGYHPGYWILVDCNDLILHVFQTEYREFYNLDGLWRDAPRLGFDAFQKEDGEGGQTQL